MGLADAFGKDDRVELKVSTLLDFMTMAADASAEAKYLMNAVNCEVPHKFIREMATGKKEEPSAEWYYTTLERLKCAPVTAAGSEEQPVVQPVTPPPVKADEEQAENDTKVEKQEESGKKKLVDSGRIIALANAGWDKQKIADDVGCSVATVYNVLKKSGGGCDDD